MELKKGFWEIGMTKYLDTDGKLWDVDPVTGIYAGERGKLFKAGSTSPVDERFIEYSEDELGNKKYVIKDAKGRIYESGADTRIRPVD